MEDLTLYEMFKREGIIRIIGAHNALGAKIAERAGADGVWASGFEISASFAVPDADILTMSEYLSVAQSMVEAVNIPVIADCDTGFGNSSNVIHMVKKYEAAGISAVCIEDKCFPKNNSLTEGRQVLSSIAEFVGKIMAAKSSQRSQDFMVIARVEALIAGLGMEEALKRAHSYADAGADAILIHSKSKSPNEIIAFTKEWDFCIPLVLVPTTYYNITLDDLNTLGIKMVIYANQGIRASIKTLENTFNSIINDKTTLNIEPKISPLSHVFELQGFYQMKQNEENYLRSDKSHIRVLIPAAGNHLKDYSMKNIAADIPITMLDINGKTLLERQVQILNKLSIMDITVIGGYKRNQIKLNGIKKIANPFWNSTGIAYSILCDKNDYDGYTLIIFADIIFDEDIINKLIKCEKDIVIVGDKTFDSKSYKPNNKTTLIQVENPSIKTRRSLNFGNHTRVAKIGKSIDIKKADYEFAGLMIFSKNGLSLFKKTYEKILNTEDNIIFHEAIDIRKASFTDVLQELIIQGNEVNCLEVSSGWMEIHSLDDYKNASIMLSKQKTKYVRK